MGLYERIRDLAKLKGYSVNRLEQELGFARSSISKFNKNKPSVDTVSYTHLVIIDGYRISGDGYYSLCHNSTVPIAISNNENIPPLRLSDTKTLIKQNEMCIRDSMKYPLR